MNTINPKIIMLEDCEKTSTKVELQILNDPYRTTF